MSVLVLKKIQYTAESFCGTDTEVHKSHVRISGLNIWNSFASSGQWFVYTSGHYQSALYVFFSLFSAKNLIYGPALERVKGVNRSSLWPLLIPGSGLLLHPLLLSHLLLIWQSVCVYVCVCL